MQRDPLDSFHEECGVFGVFGSEEASVLTALGLHALQHRGQEAAGIVTYDGQAFHAHRALGHVGDNFGADSPQMQQLRGHVAIGHNRYATRGAADAITNIQPLFFEAMELIRPLENIKVSHVRRESNQVADYLANQAILEQKVLSYGL